MCNIRYISIQVYRQGRRIMDRYKWVARWLQIFIMHWVVVAGCVAAAVQVIITAGWRWCVQSAVLHAAAGCPWLVLARPPSTIPHYLHSTFSSAPSNILCTAPHQPPPATTSHHQPPHTSDHKQWSVFVSVSLLQPPYSLFIDYTFPHNTFYPHLMKGIISREVNNCKYVQLLELTHNMESNP